MLLQKVGFSRNLPHFLPPRLNDLTYRQFFQDTLPDLLEEDPFAVRGNTSLMQYGAPAHFSHTTRKYHNDTSAQQGIGRFLL